jgi:hypothetical protein
MSEISNEQIWKKLGNIEAKLAIFAGGAAGGSSVSGQASSGADAAVGAARTKSNKEVDSGTESVFKTVAQDSDINAPESWQAFLLEGAMRDRERYNSEMAQERKHKSNLDAMNLQSVANNQNQSNINNHIAIDRVWNINEDSAFAVLLNKVVADAVKAEMSKEG